MKSLLRGFDRSEYGSAWLSWKTPQGKYSGDSIVLATTSKTVITGRGAGAFKYIRYASLVEHRDSWPIYSAAATVVYARDGKRSTTRNEVPSRKLCLRGHRVGQINCAGRENTNSDTDQPPPKRLRLKQPSRSSRYRAPFYKWHRMGGFTTGRWSAKLSEDAENGIRFETKYEQDPSAPPTVKNHASGSCRGFVGFWWSDMKFRMTRIRVVGILDKQKALEMIRK